MNKNRIRLTESQLHNVIKGSVKNILREGWPDDSYGSMGDSASSGRSIRLSDEEREEKNLRSMLGSLISIHKFEDGHYRVLVPPHFASEMKALEDKGVEFVGCDSDYTPMAIYIHNGAIKNRADEVLGQLNY